MWDTDLVQVMCIQQSLVYSLISFDSKKWFGTFINASNDGIEGYSCKIWMVILMWSIVEIW